MTDKIFYLEGINPIELYGINDSRLNRLKTIFPKLKIVARGGELKVFGESIEIQAFEHKFRLLCEHILRTNSLSNADFEQIVLHNSAAGNTNSSDDLLIFGNNGKMIKARSENQHLMVQKSHEDDLVFAVGPAGSGKTYTAIALAVRALRNKEVRRIILSRPAVEAGENLGFLPGDMKEKIDPYLQPLYDALNDMIPSKKLKDYLVEGIIQIAPLAFMRGRTLDNAFVILDEAQNTTINQFKMFLTRMGPNAKFIVTGDITQIDLPKKTQSGLLQALRILDKIKGISIIYFNKGDIIRHNLVKKIVNAYEDFEEPKKD